MKCIFIICAYLLLCSCTKDKSCEINCSINPLQIHDTATILQTTYNYSSAPYHALFEGTGNNSFGYSIPQFDTALGTIDSFQVKVFTTLKYFFSAFNNSTNSAVCSINISRSDSLIFDSVLLIANTYKSGSLQQNIPALLTVQDTLMILNNVETTSTLTNHLEKLYGTHYIALEYHPSTNSAVSGTINNAEGNFEDSIYIVSTYFYKKRI